MRPKVIHPREVLLYKRGEVELDALGGKKSVTWEAPVALQGQVKYDKFQQLEPIGFGNDPLSSGHIVFYDKDWVASGGKVYDEMELEEDYVAPSRLVVTEIRPAAHYHGKNWHVHVFFQRKRAVSK